MRSQVSFEFVLIFTLVLAALVGFVFLINYRLGEVNEQRQDIEMRNLANTIKNELILARSVTDNYYRSFELPLRLGGSYYDIWMDEGFLNIQTDTQEFATPLPLETSGAFIEEVTAQTVKHCITKKGEEIRVSKNQAVLWTEPQTISEGEEFDLIVSLYCVENIGTVRVTIAYNSNVLGFGSDPIRPITTADAEFTPLFEDYILQYGVNNYDYPLSQDLDTRSVRTYGFLGSGCGTGFGDVIKIPMRASGSAPPGEYSIDFFTGLEGEDNLKLLDCITLKDIEALPDTRVGTSITIT